MYMFKDYEGHHSSSFCCEQKTPAVIARRSANPTIPPTIARAKSNDPMKYRLIIIWVSGNEARHPGWQVS